MSTGPSFHDPTSYRSLVGALQYLTITRSDLSYAVSSVSQFLHAPIEDHFLAVKCILRYVKGTIHFGLSFTKQSDSSILGYSDVDWERCIAIVVSLTGIQFSLEVILSRECQEATYRCSF